MAVEGIKMCGDNAKVVEIPAGANYQYPRLRSRARSSICRFFVFIPSPNCYLRQMASEKNYVCVFVCVSVRVFVYVCVCVCVCVCVKRDLLSKIGEGALRLRWHLTLQKRVLE